MRIFWVSFLLLLHCLSGRLRMRKLFRLKSLAFRAPDFCRIYGSVYFERDPRRKYGTHFTIYEETEEAFANLVVYKEDNKLFADAARPLVRNQQPRFCRFYYFCFTKPQPGRFWRSFYHHPEFCRLQKLAIF